MYDPHIHHTIIVVCARDGARELCELYHDVMETRTMALQVWRAANTKLANSEGVPGPP